MPSIHSEDYLKTMCRNCSTKPNLNMHTIFVFFLTAYYTNSITSSQRRGFSRCSTQFHFRQQEEIGSHFRAPVHEREDALGTRTGHKKHSDLKHVHNKSKKQTVKNDVGIRHFSLKSFVTSLKTATFCEMQKFSTGLLTENGWHIFITSCKSKKPKLEWHPLSLWLYSYFKK